jgi:O-antigen/teichoic acid export membrane protein
MARDDVGPLVLSILSLVLATFVGGIVLVPTWSPEIIGVLGSVTAVMILFSVLAALRNAFRRREFWWLPAIILLGPLGVLSYSLIKTTESGLLAAYFEELSDHTVGKRDESNEHK